MKVLHIIDHMGLGGAQVMVGDIASHMKHDVFPLREKWRLSFPYFSLKSYIRKNNFQIIHCHLQKSILMGWLLKKTIPNLQLILHEHGTVLDNSWYSIMLKMINKDVDTIIVNSSAAHDAILKAGFRNSQIVELKNYVTRDLQKSIPQDLFTIGFVGRLSKVKGCTYLIESLGKLEFPYRAVIVGDGPYFQKLKRQVRGMPVEFTGEQPVEKYFQMFSVLVVPSLRESCGLSVLEAQSAGVPVICSRIEGLTEIVRHKENGLLFSSGNSADLAMQITKIRTDAGLRKTIAKNAMKSVKQYNRESYLGKLGALYQ